MDLTGLLCATVRLNGHYNKDNTVISNYNRCLWFLVFLKFQQRLQYDHGKKLDKKKNSRGCRVNGVTRRLSLLTAQYMCDARELCLASPTLQWFTDSAFNCNQSLNDLVLFLLGSDKTLTIQSHLCPMIVAAVYKKITTARGQQKCVNQVDIDLKRIIHQCMEDVLDFLVEGTAILKSECGFLVCKAVL